MHMCIACTPVHSFTPAPLRYCESCILVELGDAWESGALAGMDAVNTYLDTCFFLCAYDDSIRSFLVSFIHISF